MLSRLFLMWRALAFSFGKRLSPLFTVAGLLLLHVVVSIGMLLDHLFFPALRKRRVVAPIVIVGAPRSGTTFLHRFLVENGFGAGMRIWKMLYPSLTLQTLLRPLLPLMEKLSPARHHASVVHETSLTSIETDDPALLFRYFDGFFVYGFFLAWAREDLKSMFDLDLRDVSPRDFDYLDRMWRRNLVGEGADRQVSKLFSLTVRIPRFLEEVPDAKILYMIRDPLSTVPSGLSLVTGVLDQRFGFWCLPEETRARYLERLYVALLDVSLKFHDDWTHGRISKESVMVVAYDRVTRDFDRLMEEIAGFVGMAWTPERQAVARETAEKQRRYQSRHQYDLKKFGLDEGRIRKDYAPLYETFLNG